MITTIHIQGLLLLATAHHPSNHAILRLQKHDQTVGGIGLAYLPRRVYCVGQEKGVIPFSLLHPHLSLDLTEPGTAHALLVALALALGLDPGVGGLRCTWSRFVTCWQVESRAEDGQTRFHVFMPRSHGEDDALGRSAPTVAAEPDPIKALALAALHVLEHP